MDERNGSLPYFTAVPLNGTHSNVPSNGTFVASNVRTKRARRSGDLGSPSFPGFRPGNPVYVGDVYKTFQFSVFQPEPMLAVSCTTLIEEQRPVVSHSTSDTYFVYIAYWKEGQHPEKRTQICIGPTGNPQNQPGWILSGGSDPRPSPLNRPNRFFIGISLTLKHCGGGPAWQGVRLLI